MTSAAALLRLLQLASPALPVGAYSYSEGVETLIHQGRITSGENLAHWLIQELEMGAIRLEAAVMGRAMVAWQESDLAALERWNHWLSAVRETEELRQQSWQMGRSLLRLLRDLEPGSLNPLPDTFSTQPCNFAIAFGIAAALWQLPIEETILIYLQSWAANLISAGVRLVPLGQTEGQRLLGHLADPLSRAAERIPTLLDHDLTTCSWGLTLASMTHETQYSRLFRS
ncbi:urease accessory protein UreF [Leptolyngbya sp. PCC 6406]|uniref:urease accessory protein UreF n=1 Tax=Leptolyngbya sp. PCC 6406 TaxID=1173264 RepID=UPI0002ABD186|nr:urease accessory protein UreF [Leptolyngbya sp. PCC 6406]